jgi:polyisoprenoid-binding protein YceI
MNHLITLLACTLLALAPAPAATQPRHIDVEHSRLTIHVYKSGLFAFAADNHEINAPIATGELDDPLTSVNFTVPTARITVLDPKMDPGKRAQVQERMVGPDVLDTAKYPEITFKSTSISAASGGWDVKGELTLHGVTRAIQLHVTQTSGHYRGSTSLKQTDFGISPITIAGGTVKVKDVVQIDFDIATL